MVESRYDLLGNHIETIYHDNLPPGWELPIASGTALRLVRKGLHYASASRAAPGEFRTNPFSPPAHHGEAVLSEVMHFDLSMPFQVSMLYVY